MYVQGYYGNTICKGKNLGQSSRSSYSALAVRNWKEHCSYPYNNHHRRPIIQLPSSCRPGGEEQQPAGNAQTPFFLCLLYATKALQRWGESNKHCCHQNTCKDPLRLQVKERKLEKTKQPTKNHLPWRRSKKTIWSPDHQISPPQVAGRRTMKSSHP